MQVNRIATAAALCCGLTAFGQSINIEFGDGNSVPPASYGAAGLGGVWNSLPGTQNVVYPLVNLAGNPTSATVYNFGGTALIQADDPATSGADEALLDEYLVTYSPTLETCLFFAGLQNGTYQVISYAWTPNTPALDSKVRVDFSSPFQLVGGPWNGTHLLGVTYASHIVQVTNGTIGSHSGLDVPGGGAMAALNGVQLRLLPTAPFTSANPPLDNPFVSGTQPFRDVLQTGSGSNVTQGIGAAGTPSENTTVYSSISVSFAATPSPSPTPANVAINCTGGTCPTISSVTGAGIGPYVISLSGPIPPGHCTTFTFAGNAASQELQYQSLPGDMNFSGTVSATDLTALLNALNNGQAALPANLPRYDVNRNGAVSLPDLLRLVGLLNGVNTTQPWAGSAVATCP